MRHAICYVSNSNLEHQEAVELLEFCQNRNEELDVKGVLLYSEGNFLQILEGKKKVVLDLFDIIQKDSRHHGIIQLIGRDIEHGSYDGYEVDVLSGEFQYDQEIPAEYLKALDGIPPKVKKPMERMLTMFIATQ